MARRVAGWMRRQWTDLEHPLALPYVRSKVLAEREAWRFMAERGAEERLAVVLPSVILGPVLGPDFSYSVQVVARILNPPLPAMPRIGLDFVDVRDVADLHIRAMIAERAAGQRFLSTAQFMWLSDTAALLRDRLGPAAARVPTWRAPNFLLRGLALFDPTVRQLAAHQDVLLDVSATKAKTMLDWTPRPIEETIVDCARRLILLRGDPRHNNHRRALTPR
jgi:dihydroflavonol-4-reductase